MKKFTLLTCACALMVPTLSFANTGCVVLPKCDEMGYTRTEAECSGQPTIKCPFDATRVFCDKVTAKNASAPEEDPTDYTNYTPKNPGIDDYTTAVTCSAGTYIKDSCCYRDVEDKQEARLIVNRSGDTLSYIKISYASVNETDKVDAPSATDIARKYCSADGRGESLATKAQYALIMKEKGLASYFHGANPNNYYIADDGYYDTVTASSTGSSIYNNNDKTKWAFICVSTSSKPNCSSLPNN